MRVTLIQPPMFHQQVHLAPNLGLAYIAAVLLKDGVEVQVIDAAAEDLGYDDIIQRLKEFRPDLVAAGGQTPVSDRALTIFKMAKEGIGLELKTLAGGPHFSFTDIESLQRCPELDFVARGEAEMTIVHLCRTLKQESGLEEVYGLTYRDAKGGIRRNPDREPIADLDSLPFPAWNLFPVDKYHWAGNRMIGISSSRGCPYRCPHCITWKMHNGTRRRNPKRVVEEMLWVRRNFGHDTFFFQDDASFLDRRQLEGFLEALEGCGEKLYWYYETREDVFSRYRDLWPRMKRNGMFKVVLGLETPDPSMRERFGKKGYDLNEVENMMDTLEKDLDVLVSVYLLFGLPEDTVESVEALLEYGKRLYPEHCSFIVGSLAVPFPGTEMFMDLKERGLITSYDWKDYGFDRSVIKTSVPPEKLSEVFSEFWVGTYVRPKVFLHQLEFFVSGNRFRKSMAMQFIKMGREMSSDVKKMKGEEELGF
jgi:anaerobic magnesium-protoporphyrin IX monomethyl ester cyclase